MTISSITNAARFLPLLIVFAVALTARVLHVWQMQDTPFFSVLMGDSRGYDRWARQIAAGDWIGSDVFYQAPLYPYFLASIYTLVGHDLLIVRLVQAVLGAAGCVALAAAAARLVSVRAGLIGGLMLALYPPAIFFDGLIQKSVLDVLLVCLSLPIVAVIVTEGGTPRRWLLLGVTMGALALTRENALVLIAVIAVWAAAPLYTKVHEGHDGRRSVSFVPVVAFVFGAAALLLPVALRNYHVGGEFHLTTSQFGSNLYIGNNPRASGSYMSLREGRGSPEYERQDATELAEQAAGRRLSPSEVSGYWRDRTLHYIADQPGDWVQLLARKARLLISSTEIIDTESQESHAEYSIPLRVLGALWHFGVLLPLAIVGVCLLWPRRGEFWPLYALAFIYAATVVGFFVVARYRLPLVPYLMVFAAAGVAAIIDGRQRLAILRLATRPRVLATVVVLALGSNWPLHTAASQKAITENNLGAALQESGRPAEAIAHYRRALSLDPAYAPALTNLGTALRATGQVNEAVAAYDEALAARPNDVSTYLNRGNALMSLGKIDEAVVAFREAVKRDPRSTRGTSALATALYDQGTAAIEVGAFDRAVAALREAVAVRPDYAEAHNNLGIALASQGKIKEAIAEWENALRLNPKLQDARANLQRARSLAR